MVVRLANLVLLVFDEERFLLLTPFKTVVCVLNLRTAFIHAFQFRFHRIMAGAQSSKYTRGGVSCEGDSPLEWRHLHYSSFRLCIYYNFWTQSWRLHASIGYYSTWNGRARKETKKLTNWSTILLAFTGKFQVRPVCTNWAPLIVGERKLVFESPRLLFLGFTSWPRQDVL